MPIDYSKWDNLELSDDSDVEAHPNIEKGTFVRLRQRKIREDRENRRIRRERIEATLAMNQGLISRLTTVRDSFQGSDLPKVIEQLDRDVEQARKQKEEGENSQEQPSETDMVNALMARITDDLLQSAANLDTPELKRDAYVSQLTGHLEKLDKVMNDLERELVEVKKEEAKHISPDSIMHTGFDRSF
ncbi:hsp90 co-chaperone Cdc37, partial [Coemansia sp. RSA 2531]